MKAGAVNDEFYLGDAVYVEVKDYGVRLYTDRLDDKHKIVRHWMEIDYDALDILQEVIKKKLDAKVVDDDRT